MNPFQKIWAVAETTLLESKSDVISLIKADHRKVDQLFERYVKSTDNHEKRSIVKKIINDLRIHAGAEEGKVYPVLDREDHCGTNESLEEHHLIKILIEELSLMRVMNDKVDAKMKVLSEVVKHHVQEEEFKYLPELKESDADLDELGETFTAEKLRLEKDPEKKPRKKSSAKLVSVKNEPVVKKATRRKADPSGKSTAAKSTAAKKPSTSKKAPKRRAS
jgi:hemerythrin superfamily protein